MPVETEDRSLVNLRTSSLFTGSLPNLFGLAFPLLLGAFSIPYIIAQLGVARFGALTLIWAVLGYFSLFDFGISRALTKRVAELAAPNSAAYLGRAIRAGLLMLLGLGALVALLTLLTYGVAVKGGYVRDSREVFLSMLYLAFGMPFLLVGLGLRGILEGLQRFSPPNWSRVLLGIITFGVPVPLLKYSPSLDILVAALSLGRILTILLQGWACRHELRLAISSPTDRAEVVLLLRFGGWLTVSNLVSPIMVFIDRFVVGASPHAAALAYYTTPFEMVTRLLIVPGAITTALFPKMVVLHGGNDSSAGNAMLKGMALTLVFLTPLVISIQVFAPELLGMWLGDEFVRYGALPMQLIAWGVLLNAMAQFPFAYLQSAGRPSWIARLHLAELPIYLLLLFFCLESWGIRGVAAVWLIRTGIDLLLLSVMSLFVAPRQVAFPMLAIHTVAMFAGSLWLWGVHNHLDWVERSVACAVASILFAWIFLRVGGFQLRFERSLL